MLTSLIVGAGCFWGVEALYEDMPGVLNATSGYAGGSLENPRYEDVLTGETGHVEVVKIDYDTSEVTFDTLIDAFFIMHDPTTLNRQGPDIGEQYKSVIFYNNDEEKNRYVKKLIARLTGLRPLGMASLQLLQINSSIWLFQELQLPMREIK